MPPDQTWCGKEDLFLHPDNLELSRQLCAGGDVALLAQSVPEGIWSAEQLDRIHKRLHSWLTTRDFKELVALLNEDPSAFAHPIVLRQWLRLREVEYAEFTEDDVLELEEIGCEVDLDDYPEPLQPAGASLAAGKIMRELLTVWVLRQFPCLPGYTLELKKWLHRPGPKRMLDDEQLEKLLQAYNHCRQQLQSRGKPFFKPVRGERPARFRSRIAGALMKLNLAAIFVGPPLSQERAESIVRESEGKYGVKFDFLVLNFLAHMAKATAGQVRGHLQRAEKRWPYLHERRFDSDRW